MKADLARGRRLLHASGPVVAAAAALSAALIVQMFADSADARRHRNLNPSFGLIKLPKHELLWVYTEGIR